MKIAIVNRVFHFLRELSKKIFKVTKTLIKNCIPKNGMGERGRRRSNPPFLLLVGPRRGRGVDPSPLLLLSIFDAQKIPGPHFPQP